MLNDLYNDQLLAAAASLPPARRLDAPDGTSTRVSRVCGSRVTLDLAFENGAVRDFGLDVKACAIGQAAAGLFAASCPGAPAGELIALREIMRALLNEDGPPPAGRFAALGALAPIAAYPQRHSSALLVFEAAREASISAGFDGHSENAAGG